MSQRRIVITGLGAITPNGLGKEQIWNNALEGRNCISDVTKFDTTNYPVSKAGEVQPYNESDFIARRQQYKLDPFTKYAVVAAKHVMRDTNFELDKLDPNRVGTYVGNCFGGWTFNDQELRLLHTKGNDEISPFVATAWFPAAPQGQVTIFNGFKGHSKTIDAGMASGLISIGYAARAIQCNRSDVIFAGGSEALVTPYTYAAICNQAVEDGNHTISNSGTYRPFEKNCSGWLPGEGSAFLLLEELEHAKRRNAPIYAEVKGFHDISGGCHPRFLSDDPLDLAETMLAAIDDAGLEVKDIDLIVADGLGTSEGDETEAVSIQKVLEQSDRNTPVTALKPLTGHLYGAAGALDALYSVMAIRDGIIPPTINHEQNSGLLNIVTETTRGQKINCIMINSRGNNGICSSLVIGRYD